MKNLNFISQKIISVNSALQLSNTWRLFNKKWVFTNGCFDILHEGHIETISTAASKGDYLIVALNSDESVRRLKGDSRPINNQHSRALILASLAFVDYVVIFEEETPFNLIRLLLPNVLVKGGDYTIGNVIGAKEVIENGGEVFLQPTKIGFSTTQIINHIKS